MWVVFDPTCVLSNINLSEQGVEFDLVYMLGVIFKQYLLDYIWSSLFSILFALKSQPHKFALVLLLFLLVFALMNGYASCFLVCKQLWFNIERGAEDNM